MLTHRVPEPVEREILLNGPLVQNDVNWDAPGGSAAQIGYYCAIRQSVCRDGDYLRGTQRHFYQNSEALNHLNKVFLLV